MSRDQSGGWDRTAEPMWIAGMGKHILQETKDDSAKLQLEE